MVHNIYSAASLFEKLAGYPTLDSIKPVIKNIVEQLKSSNKDVMRGVLYVSNVAIQTRIDSIGVSFLLNVDNDPRMHDLLEVNRTNRENLIKNTVLQSLNSTFRGFEFQVRLTEFPTEKPSWFIKQPD